MWAAPTAAQMIPMTPTSAFVLHASGIAFASFAVILPAVWGGFALVYQAAESRRIARLCAAAWSTIGAAAVVAIWRGMPAYGLGAFAVAFAGLLAWWKSRKPTNEGDWADEVAQMTHGRVDGDRVTLHNVRNFEWRTTSDYTPRWETRIYDLAALRSVDLVLSYWRGPAIAHMLVSFGFADDGYVAFSVEIRRRRSQQFSEIGGFFKEFELCIIATDEYDSIRLRSNIRGERVHVYRLQLAQADARSLFLAYVSEANRLLQSPRFYNTITVNCTTLVYRMMRRIVGHLPFSYRLLFTGYVPEYVYAIGGFDRRYSLQELRTLGYISDRARQSEARQHFSTDIRRGVPDGREVPARLDREREPASRSAVG
jgi:hypothetical protein